MGQSGAHANQTQDDYPITGELDCAVGLFSFVSHVHVILLKVITFITEENDVNLNGREKVENQARRV
jgi:hypothetical protein